MLAAPHVLRQRARRPQRPRSNCPAAVVVSLPTSGSAPQPGRMSNRVDISALWRMYYRWHRLRLRDARVRERRRHVLRPRHIPRARATRSAICKVRWQWRHTAALLPTSRQQSLRTSGASSHARCVLRMRECARHADSVARLPRAQRALHLATCVTKRRCDVATSPCAALVLIPESSSSLRSIFYMPPKSGFCLDADSAYPKKCIGTLFFRGHGSMTSKKKRTLGTPHQNQTNAAPRPGRPRRGRLRVFRPQSAPGGLPQTAAAHGRSIPHRQPPPPAPSWRR
mmetsp:Transcript_9326/g.28161  ORF Transcript_9326/g.28161 Transcript_9326/m.28161 type:complete len:283 (+) Transcript_9326:814-1662(+)